METLKAFWHWVDNENPSADSEVWNKAYGSLSEAASDALHVACSEVGTRAASDYGSLAFLMEHRVAIRDLSLALCEPFARMHEQVPPKNY